MAQKKFLVTGATGATGGYAVGRLLERGHAVRALAHRADDRSKRLEKMGAEVLIGDLLNFNDVRTALGGIRGAYFVYPLRACFENHAGLLANRRTMSRIIASFNKVSLVWSLRS